MNAKVGKLYIGNGIIVKCISTDILDNIFSGVIITKPTESNLIVGKYYPRIRFDIWEEFN